MRNIEDELIVLDIAGSYARLKTGSPITESALITKGFIREGEQLIKPIIDDSERRNVVCDLILMGALFAAGRDWSPAELVDFYKEQGLFTQQYRVISWKNSGSFEITSK